MAVRAGIVECPHCGNHLQDTRQEFIDCRFCGKRFKRGTLGKEKEEQLRRDMLLDLSDKIQKEKVIIFTGRIFGAVFLIFFILYLFSEALYIFEIILIIAFLVNGIAWLSLSAVFGRRLEKDQSKMFDLSGGRAVFEY